jgi:hypothetical protein
MLEEMTTIHVPFIFPCLILVEYRLRVFEVVFSGLSIDILDS